MAGQVLDDAEFPDYSTDRDFMKLLWSYCLVKAGGKRENKKGRAQIF